MDEGTYQLRNGLAVLRLLDTSLSCNDQRSLLAWLSALHLSGPGPFAYRESPDPEVTSSFANEPVDPALPFGAISFEELCLYRCRSWR